MRLYFAGVDCYLPTRTAGLALFQDVPNVLVTYIRMEKKVCWDAMIALNNEKLMLDSGIFTLKTSMAGQFSVKDYWDYFAKYVKCILKYRKHIEAFVEFDVDEELGIDMTRNFRKEFNALGLKPLMVWHWQSGLRALKEILDQTDYFSISGGGSTRSEKFKILDLVFKYCPKGTKIHGLGITDRNSLLRYPFYSVDSSTWSMGSRKGQLYHFDEKALEMHIVHYRNKKKMLKYFKGLYFPGLFEDGHDGPHAKAQGRPAYVARDEFNVREFRKMERIVTEIWKKRGVEWDKKPLS